MQEDSQSSRKRLYSTSSQAYKYGTPELYQLGSGSHGYNPYRDTAGYALHDSAAAKHLRHASSYQDQSPPLSAGLSSKANAVSRSQLAEQKHIQRQNSMSDKSGSTRARPMSAERSRPGSAHPSLSRESSGASLRRLSSLDRLSLSAADVSKFGGNSSSHSVSRPGSRPASPKPHAQSHTIPAYNPSFGRSSLSNSISATASSTSAHKPPGSSSYSSLPGNLLTRSSSAVASGKSSFDPQAAYLRDLQRSLSRQAESKAKDAGAQTFLSDLAGKSQAASSSSMHPQPKRSNSNPMALLGMSGQYLNSLGSHICSMTSPQRRTSSSALAEEPQQRSHEEVRRPGSAAVRPTPRQQLLHEMPAWDGNLAAGDRGHIFNSGSLEDDRGHLSQRVSVPQATSTASSSYRSAPARHLAAAETDAARQSTAGTAYRGGFELPQSSSSYAKSSLTAAMTHAKVRHDSSTEAATRDESAAESGRHVRPTAELDTLLKIHQSLEKKRTGSAESLPDWMQAAHRREGHLSNSVPAVSRAAANSPQGRAPASNHQGSSSDADQDESAEPSAAARAAAQAEMPLVTAQKGEHGKAGLTQATLPPAVALTIHHQPQDACTMPTSATDGEAVSQDSHESAAASAEADSGMPEMTQPSVTSELPPQAAATGALPGALPTAVATIATQLAESVRLPDTTQQRHPASSAALFSPAHSVQPHVPFSQQSHESIFQQQPQMSSSAANSEQVQLTQPLTPHADHAQPSDSAPELDSSAQLSPSQHQLEEPSGLTQRPSTLSDAAPEQPSASQSPSRQLSGASSELKEAIKLSLSQEFLPHAESDLHAHSDSLDASQAAAQTAEWTLRPESPARIQDESQPGPSLAALESGEEPESPAVASPSSSSSAGSDASADTEMAEPFYPEEELYADPPSPQSHPPLLPHSERQLDPSSLQTGQDQVTASHGHDGVINRAEGMVGTAPAASAPRPDIPTGAEAQGPKPGLSAAALDGFSAPDSSNAEASTPGQNSASAMHSSVQHPLAPIYTGAAAKAQTPTLRGSSGGVPSPKPPAPSPGTAAQIDGDEALARKLQNLELADNPEAADAVAADASAHISNPAAAEEGDVDLSALQDVEVPLIGDQLPLAALVEDYEGSPRVCANLVPLMQRFPYFRRIRGDGNCFYRALVTAVLEDLCISDNVVQCRRLRLVLLRLKDALKRWEDGITDAYYKRLRNGWSCLEEILKVIETRGVSPEQVIQHCISHRGLDRDVVHFLRGITALELFNKQELYKTFIPGIDAYGGLSMEDIIVQAVLPMGAEVEHLQVKALVAALPVRLKILDVAGSAGSIYTFEPTTPDSTASIAAASTVQQSSADVSHRQSARPEVQKLWLIYRPGHYEIVYPADGCEDLEKL